MRAPVVSVAPVASVACRRLLPYLVLVVGIPVATVVAGVITFWIAAAGAETIAPEPAIKRGLVVEDPRTARATPVVPSGTVSSTGASTGADRGR